MNLHYGDAKLHLDYEPRFETFKQIIIDQF